MKNLFNVFEESIIEEGKVKIQQASGEIEATFRKYFLSENLEGVVLSRTALRIFSGNVLFDW
jgi:2-methylaconitate cis-trans-isomerase PrpF